jgi:acetyl esterase
MSGTTRTQQPPRRVRLLYGLKRDSNLQSLSNQQLIALAEAQNRTVSSKLMRLATGFPDRGASIGWQHLTLPDRELPVRVYRPNRGPDARLPLVIHVHGGAFVGTAVQCDWINSLLAARLPAVVVSVEHRLLNREIPLSAAVDDGWDALRHVVRHAEQWGIDPARVAVAGESCGALVTAMTAISARKSNLELRAQVLVNPAVDVTSTAFEYASMTEYGDSPTLKLATLELFRQLAVPQGTDPRTLSPLHADDLSGLPPTLVVIPVLDPVADHGRTYAGRLREAGTSVRVTEHPKSGHAFISMPGLDPAARVAGRDVLAFLSGHLHPATSPKRTAQR